MSEGEGREGFLGRWSRRKRAEPEVREEEDVKTAQVLAEERARLAPQPVPAAPLEVPPDLPAVETLTPESDYTRFMKPDVPIASRNAAMKKLFTDPHFNVMDGLDIYIDDYTKEDPIPMAMLRDLAQSKMLGLFKEEEAAEEKARQELANQTAAVAEAGTAKAESGVDGSNETSESTAQSGSTPVPALTAPTADAQEIPSVGVRSDTATDSPTEARSEAPSEAKRAEPYNLPASSAVSPPQTISRPDSA